MLKVAKLIVMLLLRYRSVKRNNIRPVFLFLHSITSSHGNTLVVFIVFGEIPNVLIIGSLNVFRLTLKSLVPVRFQIRLRCSYKLANACSATSIEHATRFFVV